MTAKLGNDVAAAVDRLSGLMPGMWVTRMIHAIAELGVADALPDDGSVAVEELATATGTDSDALHRVLRALAAHGVYVSAEDRRYAHTELSRLLRRDHPYSLRNLALIGGAPWQWESWSGLTDSLRTGESAVGSMLGKDLWAHFAEDDPAAGAVFQRAMTDFAAMTDGPLADALDLSAARTVVDAGGGHGNFLSAVLDRYPHIDAVLFESEATLRSMAADPRTQKRPGRFRIETGNLLDAVDCPADVYLLKQVLHLFDDETAERVLRNCAASAKPGARIVVVERVITDGPHATHVKLIDVLMFVTQQQGRERTEREFAELFDRAGLRFAGVTPTPSPLCLIEGLA